MRILRDLRTAPLHIKLVVALGGIVWLYAIVLDAYTDQYGFLLVTLTAPFAGWFAGRLHSRLMRKRRGRTPIPIPVCTCQSHEVIGMQKFRLGLAAPPEAHTIVMLGLCAGCGKLTGFPQQNLALAMTEGTHETSDVLFQLYCDLKMGQMGHERRDH